jgi:hypothetical protein
VLEEEDDEDEAPAIDETPLLDEPLADDAPPSLPGLLDALPPGVPQLAIASAAGTERSQTRARPLVRWERTTNAIIERYLASRRVAQATSGQRRARPRFTHRLATARPVRKHGAVAGPLARRAVP